MTCDDSVFDRGCGQRRSQPAIVFFVEASGLPPCHLEQPNRQMVLDGAHLLALLVKAPGKSFEIALGRIASVQQGKRVDHGSVSRRKYGQECLRKQDGIDIGRRFLHLVAKLLEQLGGRLYGGDALGMKSRPERMDASECNLQLPGRRSRLVEKWATHMWCIIRIAGLGAVCAIECCGAITYRSGDDMIHD